MLRKNSMIANGRCLLVLVSVVLLVPISSTMVLAQSQPIPAINVLLLQPDNSFVRGPDGSVSEISDSDSFVASGNWDGTVNGNLDLKLVLKCATTVTWDAVGSAPNTNPTVGLLVSYANDATSDGDDLATYPDEENNVEFLMALTVPAGTYTLTFEGTEGHDSYVYMVEISVDVCAP